MSRSLRSVAALVGVTVVLAGCGAPDRDEPGSVAIGEACGGFSAVAAAALERASGTSRVVVERDVELAPMGGQADTWVNPKVVCAMRPAGGSGEADERISFSVVRGVRAPDSSHPVRGSLTLPIGLGAYGAAGEADIYFRCGGLGVVRARLMDRSRPGEDFAKEHITALQDLAHRASQAWRCAAEARVPSPGRK